MATTLPNMSLVIWDGSTDNFSHVQLAQNFTNLDGHDHTSGKGKQIGPGGVANLSIGTAQIADSSVTDGKISPSFPITDAKLNSPNNAIYRYIMGGMGYATSATTGTGPYFLGAPLVAPSVATTALVPTRYLAIADFAVNGKTPALQTNLVILTNNVVPGVTFTLGLNLITVDSVHATTGNIAYNAGSQIANSQAAIATPAQNTQSVQSSVDFGFPTDGYYSLVMSMSGTPGVGAFIYMQTQLRIRYT